MVDSATKAEWEASCQVCERVWPVEVPSLGSVRTAETFLPVPELQGNDLSRFLYSSCPDCGTRCLLGFGETGAVLP